MNVNVRTQWEHSLKFPFVFVFKVVLPPYHELSLSKRQVCHTFYPASSHKNSLTPECFSALIHYVFLLLVELQRQWKLIVTRQGAAWGLGPTHTSLQFSVLMRPGREKRLLTKIKKKLAFICINLTPLKSLNDKRHSSTSPKYGHNCQFKSS